MFYPNVNVSPSQIISLPQAVHAYQPIQAIPSYIPQPPFSCYSPQPIFPQQAEQTMVPVNICMQGNPVYTTSSNPALYDNSSHKDLWIPYPDSYPKFLNQKQDQLAIHSPEDDRYRKEIIVNYLAPKVTKEDLFELFSRFGPLDGAHIIYDRQTKLPRGYGFVCFRNPESASKAMEVMNGYKLCGKRLRVSYSTKPSNIVSNDSASSHMNSSAYWGLH